MADELSLVLWSLAEYFNYFAVVLIMLSSIIMTLFIVRHNGDYVHHHSPELQMSSLAYEKPITELCNPFYLTLSGSTVSNLIDGLSIEVSCLVLSKLTVFWGPGVDTTQQAVLKNGSTFLDNLQNSCLLHGQCLAHEQLRLDTSGKHSLHLPTPPGITAAMLGSPPRKCYPCVIIMTADVYDNMWDSETVAAVVTMIHLKDELCPLNSHIIGQYAKMSGPAVYNLQALYFASEIDTSGTRSLASIAPTNAQQNQDASLVSANDFKMPVSNVRAVSDHAASISGGASISSQEFKAKHDTVDHTGVHCLTRSSSLDGTVLSGIGRCISVISTSPATGLETTATGGVEDIMVPSEQMKYKNSDMNTPHEFPDCIVCQTQRLTCVLLPCRHACVCRRCFVQLDRCPMCRSHVESYFLLADDEASSEILDQDSHSSDLFSRLELFNRKLNEFFGFS